MGNSSSDRAFYRTIMALVLLILIFLDLAFIGTAGAFPIRLTLIISRILVAAWLCISNLMDNHQGISLLWLSNIILAVFTLTGLILANSSPG